MSAAEVQGRPGSPEAVRPAASPLGWLRFLRSELAIIFGRRRNLAGIGVLAVVPVVLAVAVKLSAPGAGGGPDFIGAITGNGLFVAFAALTLEIPIFLPLAVGSSPATRWPGRPTSARCATC
jgi:ABC-2 type transport system permease protein